MNKLKLLKSQDITINEDKNNVKQINKLYKYITKLRKQLSYNFSAISLSLDNSETLKINVVCKNFIINGYKINSFLLAQNNKTIYIELLDENNNKVYTMDKYIDIYLKNRNIYSLEKLEEIKCKLNNEDYEKYDIELIWYDEPYQKYIMKNYIYTYILVQYDINEFEELIRNYKVK